MTDQQILDEINNDRKQAADPYGNPGLRFVFGFIALLLMCAAVAACMAIGC
jgi:hypothetical protein